MAHIRGMDFGDAIREARFGGRAARADWKTGQYVSLAGGVTIAGLPTTFLTRSGAGHPVGSEVPYHPTQADMLAEDWETVR